MRDDMFGMEPAEDGFGGRSPHSDGDRIVVNEIGDEDSNAYFRERVGGTENHGRGDHVNINLSIEHDTTGASEEIDNIHSFTEDL